MKKLLKNIRLVISFGVLSFSIFSAIFSISGSAQGEIVTTNVNCNLPQGGGSNVVDMYPGQTRTFRITYFNVGDGPDMNNAILDTLVGDLLEIDTATLSDQFVNADKFGVTPQALNANPPGTWGNQILYQPKSANDANGFSGSNQPGNIQIQLSECGVLEFQATLAANALERFPAGTVLNPTIDQQGIYSILRFDGNGSVQAELSLRIVDAPVTTPPITPACTPAAASGSTTGGGFNLASPQPVYTGTTANPSTGIIGSPINISTTGLQDSNNCSGNNLLNGVPCTITLQGANYNQALQGTVQNGVCQVNFPANQTPTVTGTYQAVTSLQGSAGLLETAPVSVQFTFAATSTALPRSGGLATAVFFAAGSAIAGVGTYLATRKRRLTVK